MAEGVFARHAHVHKNDNCLRGIKPGKKAMEITVAFFLTNKNLQSEARCCLAPLPASPLTGNPLLAFRNLSRVTVEPVSAISPAGEEREAAPCLPDVQRPVRFAFMDDLGLVFVWAGKWEKENCLLQH